MRRLRIRVRTLLLLVAIAASLLFVRDAWLRSRLVRHLNPKDGPYLVAAHRFQGPDAERKARALAAELRSEHGLKTTILDPNRVPTFPIRNLPGSEIVYVLVDGGATLVECKVTRDRVRRIAPQSAANDPSIPPRLAGAMITTNPFAAATPP